MRKTIATILCLALLAMTAAGCADTATNVFSSLAGYPNHAAEIRAMASLVSFTRITVTSSGTSTASSTTRTAAPLAAASAAKLWPSKEAPLIQRKRQSFSSS